MPRPAPNAEGRLQFGRRLRERAAAAGDKQAAVARKLNFQPSYISAVMRGDQRPSLEFLRRYAEAYHDDLEACVALVGIGEPEEEDERREIARQAAAEVLRSLGIAPKPPLDRMREAAPELEYDADLDGVRLEGFNGRIEPADLAAAERFIRAALSDRRRRQAGHGCA